MILAAALAVVAPVHFAVFAHTDLRLGAIVWTGRDLLVVEENTGKIEASDAAGHSFRPFTTIDPGGEEMRCVASTGLYWPAGDVYCHTADNRIVRAARDGSKVVELARLPGGGPSDGALAFDTGGRFGYALLAATGGSSSNGGSVYSIRRNGACTLRCPNAKVSRQRFASIPVAWASRPSARARRPSHRQRINRPEAPSQCPHPSITRLRCGTRPT